MKMFLNKYTQSNGNVCIACMQHAIDFLLWVFFNVFLIRLNSPSRWIKTHAHSMRRTVFMCFGKMYNNSLLLFFIRSHLFVNKILCNRCEPSCQGVNLCTCIMETQYIWLWNKCVPRAEKPLKISRDRHFQCDFVKYDTCQ